MMERQNSFSPSPQLKPSLRFSHTPRADPVKSGAIFRQNLPTPSSADKAPTSPTVRSPQEPHHIPIGTSKGVESSLSKSASVSVSPQQLNSPVNVDGPLIRPSPYGRFLPNPSPTPFGVAAWASSDLGQQISANFDALVRQSPAPRVLQTQVRQQALSPPQMRSPPNGAVASPKEQSREDASRLMPPPRSSPKSQLKNETQQQEPYSNLAHIKEWIGHQAGASQSKDEVPWQAVHNPQFRASRNHSRIMLASNQYTPPGQTNQKLELPPGYTLLFREERLQEGSAKEAQPGSLKVTSHDNQPFNEILQLQPSSVLRSHSEKKEERASKSLDSFSTPDNQAAFSPMTRSRVKAGMSPDNGTKPGNTPPTSRARTDPPFRKSQEFDVYAPASTPTPDRPESARLEARGLSAFLNDEGDEADLALDSDFPPLEDGFDHGEAKRQFEEKAGANEREDSERTQSDAADGHEGPEQVVSSQRKKHSRTLKSVQKDSPNVCKSGETRGNMSDQSKQGQRLGAISSPEKELKALFQRAGASWKDKEAASRDETPEKEAAPSFRKQAKDAGKKIESPSLGAETRRSKRLSLEEKRQSEVQDMDGEAMAEEESGKRETPQAEVSETKKRSGSSRMLRELESSLKDGDEDTVITRATKLPETAQLTKRGRLVAPRLAFWKNEFFERDQAGRIVGISRPTLEKTTPSKSRDVLVKQEPVVKVEETAVKAPSLRKDEVRGRTDSKKGKRIEENVEESKRSLRGPRKAGGEAKVSETKRGEKPNRTTSCQKKAELANAQEMEKNEEGGVASKSGLSSRVSNKRKGGEGSKTEKKKAEKSESEKPTDNLWRLRRGHKRPKFERPPAFSAVGLEHVAEAEPSDRVEEQPQPSMSSKEEEPGPSGRLQSETNKGRKKEEIDYAALNGERPRRSRPKRGVVQEGPVNSEGAELQSGNAKKRRLQGPTEDLREHKKEKLVSELLQNGEPIEVQVGLQLANGISPPSRRTKAKKGSDVSTKEKAEVSTGKKASGDGSRKEKAVSQNTKSKEAGKEGAAVDGRTLRRLRKRTSDPELVGEANADAVRNYLAEIAEKAEDFGNESVDGPGLNASGTETERSVGKSQGKRKSASAASENGAAVKDGSEGSKNEGARTESAKQLVDEQSKGLVQGSDARLRDASKTENERPVSLQTVVPAGESVEGKVSQGHVSAPQQSHVTGKADACVSTEGFVLLEKRAHSNGGRSEPVHTEPVHSEPVHTEPVHTEPVHTESLRTKPVRIEPLRTELVHTESAASQRAISVPEPVDKTGWTASQVAALKDALARIDPTVDGLWYKVARQVPGKNHVECQAKHNEAYATPPIRPHYPRRLGMSPPPRIIIQGAGKALARATNHIKPRGFVGVQMQGVRAAREILRAQQAKQLQGAEDPLAFHVGDLTAVSPPILKPVQPQDKYIDDALHRRLQAQRRNKVLGQGGVTADLGFEGVSNEQIKGAAERIAEAAESARMLREKAAARIDEEEEVLVGDEDDEDDDDMPPFA